MTRADISLLLLITIIIIIMAFIAFFVLFGAFIFWMRKKYAPNKKLWQTGIPARARILQIWKTEHYVNLSPQYELTLQIEDHPTLGTYQTTMKVILWAKIFAQFQPGNLLIVKVDPTNPHNIALDVPSNVF